MSQDNQSANPLGMRITSVLLLSMLVSGCGTIGPQSLEATRSDYNTAIQRTNNEEMLINLVRLRYRETPLFLQISGVSSQWNLTQSLQANVIFRSGTSAPTREGGPGTGLSYSETPTVTMSPLQGKEFVQRLLQPVSLDNIVLLYRSGWPVDTIFRLTVEELNGVQNAPTASGATPQTAPTFTEFRKVVALLRRLQVRGSMELVYYGEKDRKYPVLHIKEYASDWPEVREFRAILDLNPRRTIYRLTADTTSGDGDYIAVGTRSVTGMLSYLSQSVIPPQRHIDEGLVTVTRDEQGRPFNWSDLLGDLFEVRNSAERPTDAEVAIKYRDTWFYIADADLSTKETFTMVQQLFALQADSVEQALPVLTLPLGPHP